MIRTHISIIQEIIIPFRYEQKINYKPRGLWYGIDGDWKSWCKNNMPHWIRNKNNFEIELTVDGLLIIDCIESLEDFNNKYSVTIHNVIQSIDWIKVSKEYKGIEINPYQYERRYEWIWYYGWDCSSGCVWDLNVIKKITKNELPTKTQPIPS